jgi:PIN domain nuclease of toxin-antitoxin system
LSTSRIVLDAYALLAHIQEERGWERVEALIDAASRGEHELHISVINLAQVQYRILRTADDPKAVLQALEALPLIVAPADPYVSAIVELKARYTVSLADCFAAALAIELGCPILTGDPEFRKLEAEVTVEWLST